MVVLMVLVHDGPTGQAAVNELLEQPCVFLLFGWHDKAIFGHFGPFMTTMAMKSR